MVVEAVGRSGCRKATAAAMVKGEVLGRGAAGGNMVWKTEKAMVRFHFPVHVAYGQPKPGVGSRRSG